MLANGSQTGDGTEYLIRKQLVENNLVEAIVVLPRNLFYTTDISVTLWIKKIVADKTKYTDCFKKADIKAELEVDLIRLLDRNGYPPEYNKEVYNEVFEQAENFKKYYEN